MVKPIDLSLCTITRIYVISFTATVQYGAATQGTVKVVVPHDWSTPCKAIDSGQKYDATVKN